MSPFVLPPPAVPLLQLQRPLLPQLRLQAQRQAQRRGSCRTHRLIVAAADAGKRAGGRQPDVVAQARRWRWPFDRAGSGRDVYSGNGLGQSLFKPFRKLPKDGKFTTDFEDTCDPMERSCQTTMYVWESRCSACSGTGQQRAGGGSRARRAALCTCLSCHGLGMVRRTSSRAPPTELERSGAVMTLGRPQVEDSGRPAAPAPGTGRSKRPSLGELKARPRPGASGGAAARATPATAAKSGTANGAAVAGDDESPGAGKGAASGEAGVGELQRVGAAVAAGAAAGNGVASGNGTAVSAGGVVRNGTAVRKGAAAGNGVAKEASGAAGRL